MQIKLPDVFMNMLNRYEKKYKEIKRNRNLVWVKNYGFLHTFITYITIIIKIIDKIKLLYHNLYTYIFHKSILNNTFRDCCYNIVIIFIHISS